MSETSTRRTPHSAISVLELVVLGGAAAGLIGMQVLHPPSHAVADVAMPVWNAAHVVGLVGVSFALWGVIAWQRSVGACDTVVGAVGALLFTVGSVLLAGQLYASAAGQSWLARTDPDVLGAMLAAHPDGALRLSGDLLYALGSILVGTSIYMSTKRWTAIVFAILMTLFAVGYLFVPLVGELGSLMMAAACVVALADLLVQARAVT